MDPIKPSCHPYQLHQQTDHPEHYHYTRMLIQKNADPIQYRRRHYVITRMYSHLAARNPNTIYHNYTHRLCTLVNTQLIRKCPNSRNKEKHQVHRQQIVPENGSRFPRGQYDGAREKSRQQSLPQGMDKGPTHGLDSRIRQQDIHE
jgi:hypothetical protein